MGAICGYFYAKHQLPEALLTDNTYPMLYAVGGATFFVLGYRLSVILKMIWGSYVVKKKRDEI